MSLLAFEPMLFAFYLDVFPLLYFPAKLCPQSFMNKEK
jgi:hypothetical protein